MEDGADRPLRRERVRHRVEIGLVEFPNAGSSSVIDRMSSSSRTIAVRDRNDFTFAEFRTAHGICQGEPPSPLFFYIHHCLPRVRLTLVGRQRDVDGMGSSRFPQG